MPQQPGFADTADAQLQAAEISRITGQPVNLPAFTDPDLPDASSAADRHASELISLRDPVLAERAAAKERAQKRADEIDDWFYKRGRA